jgi:hypothetical protein
LREEAMTGKASDFPTLALSRSGNTGISQPSLMKGTPSHLHQNWGLMLCINPGQDHASRQTETQPPLAQPYSL